MQVISIYRGILRNNVQAYAAYGLCIESRLVYLKLREVEFGTDPDPVIDMLEAAMVNREANSWTEMIGYSPSLRFGIEFLPHTYTDLYIDVWSMYETVELARLTDLAGGTHPRWLN